MCKAWGKAYFAGGTGKAAGCAAELGERAVDVVGVRADGEHACGRRLCRVCGCHRMVGRIAGVVWTGLAAAVAIERPHLLGATGGGHA